MRITFCEICHKKVHAPVGFMDRLQPIVCGDECRSLLINFMEMFSDENLARLPLYSYGFYLSEKEAEEAQASASKSPKTDPPAS